VKDIVFTRKKIMENFCFEKHLIMLLNIALCDFLKLTVLYVLSRANQNLFTSLY